MESYRTLLVDAFTREPLAGNAAGVVPDAAGLSGEQMQAIARELSVSETAFLLPSEEADRKVRYFSPTQEVDLCGHATIASHGALFEDGAIDAGSHTLETDVGVLDIQVTDTGAVWMTQNAPQVFEVDLDYADAADALGIDEAAFADVGADLPPAYASTGLPFLILPVNFLEHLSGMDPDMEAVEALADSHDCAGIYVFTFDAIGRSRDSTLHGRAFVPGLGVDEDPVTGTASGACGAYLDHFAAFDDEFPDRMTFEQGHFLDRPGHVGVRVDGQTVQVGGDAVVSLDGSLTVPEYEDDEIIEA
ncbi:MULTISPECIES: PhzF family phenazine biosynthesis protein [Halolamina]|uniref:Phenazine biosynthesis protein PhzF family n=1 Tax=Halolamina pelagica TaxID=699431 RepID=A0A1I5SC66_9EURY|nr:MULTISPECIES: PhzF family phenazine biosynthesis protein [Halolamina]NHX37126.1 PhzF family phenazine biosynthesis protein [Halolamina sp. R1-12]SFP68309.1 phenazine biosynthesis protein PhzF family [Halolamina pelagica]